MTKLIWDAAASRVYETGVDRGVLYIASASGVVWNGLTSVVESVSGGSPSPSYFDGVKYSNLISSEEYQATIGAFNYPDEFAPCNGLVNAANGLIFDQQPRLKFGFSYRTKVGNDVTPDLAYKIHLVYNAIASPSSPSYSTVGSSAEPVDFSWQITVLPVTYTAQKPIGHAIIDTRKTRPTGLVALENALYGTAVASPYLPTIAQLVTLLAT